MEYISDLLIDNIREGHRFEIILIIIISIFVIFESFNYIIYSKKAGVSKIKVLQYASLGLYAFSASLFSCLFKTPLSIAIICIVLAFLRSTEKDIIKLELLRQKVCDSNLKTFLSSWISIIFITFITCVIVNILFK